MHFKKVQLQTTSVCNARCLCCPYSNSWMVNNPGVMTDRLFDKILANIKREDPSFDGMISPYLANEPFADSKIIKRIEKIYKVLNNPLVEISTNTGLLSKEKILELYKVLYGKRAKLVISHHGIDKKTFEHIMKIPYEKSLGNAIDLITVFNGKIPIAIQDMAMSKDTTFHWYTPRKVKRYWDKIFKDNNLEWNDKIWLSTSQFHSRAGNVDLEGWNYNTKVRDIGPNNPFDCYRVYSDCLHVLYNGDVTLCCMSPYRHEAIFGNLNKQTISEVFNSNEYRKLLSQVHGDIESPDDFICKRCDSIGG